MPIASRIALALLLPALLVNLAVFLLPMGNLALLSFRQANEGGALLEGIAHQAGKPIQPQPDVRAGRADIHALDQAPHDPRLLGREQLLPQWIKLLQCLARLGLGQVGGVGLRGAPRADHHLRLLEERPHLVHHRGLDLARRDAPDRAVVVGALQHGLAHIIGVELPLLPRVCRRQRSSVRPVDQPAQQCRRLPAD
jgi:hypothetical protein